VEQVRQLAHAEREPRCRARVVCVRVDRDDAAGELRQRFVRGAAGVVAATTPESGPLPDPFTAWIR